jgi:hypothetical protein
LSQAGVPAKNLFDFALLGEQGYRPLSGKTNCREVNCNLDDLVNVVLICEVVVASNA